MSKKTSERVERERGAGKEKTRSILDYTVMDRAEGFRPR